MGLFAGTEFDRPPRCEKCDRLESECICPPEEPQVTPARSQQLKVFVEKRKRGKLMTVVSRHVDEPDVLQNLLTELKSKCGAGGTLRDGNIEIQGDHRDRVVEILKARDYRIM